MAPGATTPAILRRSGRMATTSPDRRCRRCSAAPPPGWSSGWRPRSASLPTTSRSGTAAASIWRPWPRAWPVRGRQDAAPGIASRGTVPPGSGGSTDLGELERLGIEGVVFLLRAVRRARRPPVDRARRWRGGRATGRLASRPRLRLRRRRPLRPCSRRAPRRTSPRAAGRSPTSRRRGARSTATWRAVCAVAS